jgi:hypothetical protein
MPEVQNIASGVCATPEDHECHRDRASGLCANESRMVFGCDGARCIVYCLIPPCSVVMNIECAYPCPSIQHPASSIHLPLDLYAPFIMPSLFQLFLQALPPQIVHYGCRLYTWARPILIEAGAELRNIQYLAAQFPTNACPRAHIGS